MQSDEVFEALDDAEQLPSPSHPTRKRRTEFSVFLLLVFLFGRGCRWRITSQNLVRKSSVLEVVPKLPSGHPTTTQMLIWIFYVLFELLRSAFTSFI